MYECEGAKSPHTQLMTEKVATLTDGIDEEEIDMDELDAEGRREIRARTERMVIKPQIDDDDVCTSLYEVVSSSGNIYTVDLDTPGGCTCPDAQYNGAKWCKHRRRVAIEITESDLPAPGKKAEGFDNTLEDVLYDLKRERERYLGQIMNINILIEELEKPE